MRPPPQDDQHAQGPRAGCKQMIRVVRNASPEALVDYTADQFEARLREEYDGPVALLLSGGSTPFPAYNRVASRRVKPSPHVYLSFTDDRHVPPDSIDSNYHNTRPLIESLGLPASRVLRVETERTLDEAVDRFDAALAAFLDVGGVFPLALVGLGEDGHTCSLFTSEDLARGKNRLAVGVQRPDGRGGISVTPGLLARVETVVFLVSGDGKRKMLGRLLREPDTITAGIAVTGHPSVQVWTEAGAWPE